jgi:hypothetical protein
VSEPVDLGLEVGEPRERFEELAAVAVGILPEPRQAVLGKASRFLGRCRPLFGSTEPCPKAGVLLVEAGRAPALGPEITPERERLLQVSRQALSVSPFAVRLRHPLAGPTDPARAGAWHLTIPMGNGLLFHPPDNIRTGRNSRTPMRWKSVSDPTLMRQAIESERFTRSVTGDSRRPFSRPAVGLTVGEHEDLEGRTG